jgi:hypothetical protein
MLPYDAIIFHSVKPIKDNIPCQRKNLPRNHQKGDSTRIEREQFGLSFKWG